jgi:hypothetical protein
MNGPTNEDLARLMPEAREEADAGVMPRSKGGPYAAASIARDTLGALVLLLMQSVVDWPNVRRTALRALYLCALIAWEAGRRMVAPKADVCAVADELVREMRFHTNGGPVETPAAKSALRPFDDGDIRRLLWDTDQWDKSKPAPWLLRDLAAALRTERERARLLRQEADFLTERSLAKGQGFDQARGHLRTVLDFMWPGDGGPTVVQRARAFLAGEGQAKAPTCTFCNGVLDDQSFQGLADRVDEAQRLQKELVAAKERADQARREVLTEDEAHAATREQLAVALREVERLRGDKRAILAAQNRAESEAVALRSECHTACAERDRLRAEVQRLVTGVERLVAGMPKGRA